MASKHGHVSSAAVITASNRAAAGVYADKSGPIVVAELREAGYAVTGPWVVSDGEPVTGALDGALSAGTDLALTTGGTGLSSTDATPEATRQLLTYEIPGIPEALRAAGSAGGVPAAVLSRGVAGVAERDGHRMLIVNLPGSSGGVVDGMAVLHRILPHALAQLRDVDHPRH